MWFWVEPNKHLKFKSLFRVNRLLTTHARYKRFIVLKFLAYKLLMRINGSKLDLAEVDSNCHIFMVPKIMVHDSGRYHFVRRCPRFLS